VGLSVRCIQIGFHIIEKPKLVDFAQVNVGRVFEDEAADVFLAYEIDVTVLLFPACRTAEMCFEVAALDPRVTAWESMPSACAKPCAVRMFARG
jgi:hypothetical protein